MPLEIKTETEFQLKNDPIEEMLFSFLKQSISKQSEFIASIKTSPHFINEQNNQSEQLKKTLEELLEETEKVKEIQQKLFRNLKEGL